MTHQNKDILIEKMLDLDSILSDAELKLIMEDAELREILEVSAAVKGASMQPSAVDVEKEWRLFRHKLRPKPSRWRWIMRVAAIFLGVLCVSAIIRYVIDSMLTDEKHIIAAESTPSAVTEVGENSDDKKEQVDEMIPVVDEAPKATVRKVKNKRPVPVMTEDEEEDMDIDEYLRLQQARIDNELALLQARLYIEELHALDVTLPIEGESVEPEPQQVRYIIMQ